MCNLIRVRIILLKDKKEKRKKIERKKKFIYV
jgi:hypothetical protein